MNAEWLCVCVCVCVCVCGVCVCVGVCGVVCVFCVRYEGNTGEQGVSYSKVIPTRWQYDKYREPQREAMNYRSGQWAEREHVVIATPHFRDRSELVESQDLARERVLDAQLCTTEGQVPR